ncbi:hypothetical protein ABL78_1195 [Leptomonas seymouri]|uniref:Uncharacterized protein n=1 Tax=Leptomonas seymouri TaxID=5684 RepID=A0A0N1I995_LEPSE|nr:hypothetical protein ABL78_1195 [Leptomonas seymouri]|eukprot:KPI89702.1 hypothetical protein ABL78_1195 [Leptomonas seymouri]
MPRSSSSGGGGSGSRKTGDSSDRKRYAPVVEKGENAWKREWSSFMSGVNLKRLRDGTSGVSLKASADIGQLEPTAAALTATTASASAYGPSAPNADTAGDVGVNSDGIPLNAGAASASFAYLFSSPAERRAEREAREREEREQRLAKKRARMAQEDPLSVMSKHQRALHDAAQRGLQLDGMNRKARRDFLHLTVSEAQKKAAEQSRAFRLHDLMDAKLEWYQQGPHPVDLIAEKLVRRKAEKKAKQLGLKYNYLAPHASWLAKRAQRRREGLLVGLGKRLVFNEEVDEAAAEKGGDTITMTVTDPLHQRTVPLRDMGLLLAPATIAPMAAADGETMEEAAADAAVESAMREDNDSDSADGRERDRSSGPPATGSAPAVTPALLPDVGVLQDPSKLATSFVRSVVRDRATAVAIQQLNRTTTFLSPDLVKGPSLTPEDTTAAQGLPLQTLMGGKAPAAPGRPSASSASAAGKPRRPTRSSAAPSFSPYVIPVSVEGREPLQSTSPTGDAVRMPHEKRKRAQTHGDIDGGEVDKPPLKRETADVKKPRERKLVKPVRTKKSQTSTK